MEKRKKLLKKVRKVQKRPKNQAERHNEGKLRWRNVPMFLIEPLIEVGQYGETKYDTFNYLKGFPVNDVLDCLKRHLSKFESPYHPDVDEESNCNHLASVAWNALVALHILKTMPHFDDRYKLHKRSENVKKKS